MGIVGLSGFRDYPGAIHISGITKRYGPEFGLAWSYGCREMFSIIAGDERSSEGEVTVDGKGPGRASPAEREGPAQARAAFRPDITVYENLAETLDSRGLTRRRSPGPWSPQSGLIWWTKRSSCWRPGRMWGCSIEALREHFRATVVCAITEPQEAISLRRRIAVMFEGAVEQVGDPHEILVDPQTLSVVAAAARSRPCRSGRGARRQGARAAGRDVRLRGRPAQPYPRAGRTAACSSTRVPMSRPALPRRSSPRHEAGSTDQYQA
jgi:hypothetical protein